LLERITSSSEAINTNGWPKKIENCEEIEGKIEKNREWHHLRAELEEILSHKSSSDFESGILAENVLLGSGGLQSRHRADELIKSLPGPSVSSASPGLHNHAINRISLLPNHESVAYIFTGIGPGRWET
jgi:hypothetical protein